MQKLIASFVIVLLCSCARDREDSYFIGGDVSGLEGTGLVLDLSGVEQLDVTENGGFVFETMIEDNEEYLVSVLTQPTEPSQTCLVTDGSGTVDGDHVYSVSVSCVTDDVPSEVTPAYEGLDGWADCVLDDGTGPLDATGAACTGDADCMLVGAMRVLAVPALSDCTDVTATDSLGAFQWICREDGGQVEVASVGFSEDGELSDLVDVATLSWRPMSVTVTQEGTEVASSVPGVWWSTPIEALPDSDGAGTAVLDSPGTLYVLDADASSDGVSIEADSVSLLTVDAALTYNDLGMPNCNELTGERADADSECLVTTGGQKCLFIEGTFDGGLADRTIYMGSTTGSTIWDVESRGGDEAISLGDGSSYNLVSGFWIHDTGSDGLVLSGGAHHNVLEHALVENTGWDGVYIVEAHDNTFHSISAENVPDDGWDIEYSTGNVFDTVWAYSVSDGFDMEASTDNLFSNVEVGWSRQDAYILYSGSSDNTFIDVRAREASYAGIIIEESGGNSFYGARVAGSGWDPMIGIYLWMADGTTFVDTRISSIGEDCFYTEGSMDVTVVDMQTTACTVDGFHASDGTHGLTVAHLTSVNSAEDGIEIHNTDAEVGCWLVNAVSAGNLSKGLNLDLSSGMRVVDLAVYGNAVDGIEMEGMLDTSFTGQLLVGANTVSDCDVIGTGEQGLETGTCVSNGSSDATLTTDVDLSSSFAGPVTTDDAANDDDTDGAAAGAEIDDWLAFDSQYRGWGIDGTGWPAAATLAGPCSTGVACRIWDFRLNASDAVLRQMHGSATADADCPDSVHGDVAVTDWQTTPNTFLVHAMELVLDDVGDDDGLCESDEACLYTPNMGAYQGEGEPATCNFQDGSVAGVTMYFYPDNGI